MAAKTEQEPTVRKSFIVGGAVIVGIAILLFVASRFIGGGGGGASEEPAGGTTSQASPAPAQSTGTQPSVAPVKAPENKLTDGGRDPFAARAGAPLAVKAPAAVSASTAHTWQLVAVSGDTATFLVDGKKVSNVALKKQIVPGYIFNSIAGTDCVTVAKKPKAFVMCVGGTPFTA